MEKFVQFKSEVEIVGQKLESMTAEVDALIAEKTALINQISDEVHAQAMAGDDQEAEFDKKISALKKKVGPIDDKIMTLEQKIEALRSVKGQKFAEVREAARKDVNDFVHGSDIAIRKKFEEVRSLRGLYIEKMLEIKELQENANNLLADFKYLSRTNVDNKYEDLKGVRLPLINSLNSNTNGDHEPILPVERELSAVLFENKNPFWFEEWKESGEVVDYEEVTIRKNKREEGAK